MTAWIVKDDSGDGYGAFATLTEAAREMPPGTHVVYDPAASPTVWEPEDAPRGPAQAFAAWSQQQDRRGDGILTGQEAGDS